MNYVPAPAFLSPLAHLSTGEDAFHRSRSFFLRRRCDVRVGVQREAGGKVAEHTADGLDVHAVLQSERRKGVPKIMKSDPRDARALQHTL